MRCVRLLLRALPVAAALALLAFILFGPSRDAATQDRVAANPCLDRSGAEILRESRIESGAEARNAKESVAKQVLNESCALNEPSDVMLTRQLFGNPGGTVPSDVLPRARRATARLAADTQALAPGVADAKWRLEGPTNIGGRILDIAIDPDNADTIFIATATGGVWRSSDAGATFESVWPSDLTQAVGALAMTKSGVLYAGTGETGPGGGSITYGGDGVYRSPDRGRTWQHIGLRATSRISRIVVDPANEDRIFVAASGNLFKGTAQRGLYRSMDGGDSWRKVLAGDNLTTGASDVAIEPDDPDVVWATMWDHQRTPDQRLYEGEGSGVFKSTDGGRTFSRVTSPGFGPDPQLGRIGIALGSGEGEGQDLVYVITTRSSGASGGVHKSTNGGTTFTPTYDVDFTANGSFVFGWWFGRIWVDPQDNDHVFVAGVTLLESTDGAATFTSQPIASLTNGLPHADQHAMAWDPKVPGRVYLGNDGGSYRSDENGAAETWQIHKYLPASQLYTLDVSEQDPTRMVGGFQDNGANRSFGAEDGGWNEYVGGDGERTLIEPTDMNVLYGCYQYGECAISTDGGENVDFFTEKVPSSRKNWTTPIEFDPEDPATIYTGGEIMSMSEDRAGSFTPISPDLSNGPGRETNPLFRNYGTLTSIAPAGTSKGIIYAGTDDGNLWYTHDQSDVGAWTKAEDEDLPRAWITRVEVDRRDPMVAYVTYSGFRQGENAAYVLRTVDGGVNWDDISGDLPKAPVNDINIVGDALFVASDFGVFVTRDAGRTWLKVGNNLPLAPIFELRYHAPTNRLYAGTFGRSIWSVDLGELDRVPAADGPAAPIAPAPEQLIPAPVPPVAGTTRLKAQLGLPLKRCLTSRRVRFRVKAPRGTELRVARVYVNGKRVAVRRGARLRRIVSVKRPRRSFTVKIVGRTTDGRRFVQKRRYGICRRSYIRGRRSR